MSDKKLVNKDELLEILNKGLKEWGEGEKCRFESIDKTPHENPEVCNWKANIRCSGQSLESCRDAYRAVATDAIPKYNLK